MNKTTDKRYTVGLEFTGHPSAQAQYVARFCGDWIGDAASEAAAQVLISQHATRRGFDLLTRFDDGDAPVLWLHRKGAHRVACGADMTDTRDAVEAARAFGDYVLHSLTCAGKVAA